jgi:hypothetical protein
MRIAFSFCFAIVMLTGCNGPQGSAIPAETALSELKAPVTIYNQKSGDAATTSEDLIYLSYGSCSSHIKSACVAEVVIYTFPGGQPIGTWYSAGYALGECADESGNVFVTYINSGSIGEILKFAHGGTSPVATLSDPTGTPVACSVDTISGDLAVVNASAGVGTLLIYSKASGSPTAYSYPGVTFYGVSYDNKGNVFVDGLTGSHSSQFVLAKLPKGGNSFENITLNEQVAGAAELFWDGKYLTTDGGYRYRGQDEFDRFDIRGRFGRFVGATRLRRFSDGIDQYSIVGKHVVVAYFWKPCRAICGDEGTVGIWNYPSGRLITKHFTSYGPPSTGMALSLAQKRP